MKQLTIMVCALFLTVGLFAQDEVDMMSKRGVPILPVQGEMALGVDAMPIVGYFGDLFNGFNGGNNANFGFINGIYNANSIYVKYYLEDQVAIRGAVRLGYTSNINREFVTMDQDIPDPLALVTDVNTFNAMNMGIGGDYLMYRGKGRVQGYFGGGAFFNLNSWTNKVEYGNEMTTHFNSPNSYDFGIGAAAPTASRVLETYNKASMGVTVRGVIGVEYFFAPKISIGGEMGLGFNAQNDGGFQEVQNWTGTEIEVVTTEVASDGFIGVDNFTSASLFLMFHF